MVRLWSGIFVGLGAVFCSGFFVGFFSGKVGGEMAEGFSMNRTESITEVQERWKKEHGTCGKAGGEITKFHLEEMKETLDS